MKILFVLPEYLPRMGGGIITNFSSLMPWLARAGHEVSVIYGSTLLSGNFAEGVGYRTDKEGENGF